MQQIWLAHFVLPSTQPEHSAFTALSFGSLIWRIVFAGRTLVRARIGSGGVSSERSHDHA